MDVEELGNLCEVVILSTLLQYPESNNSCTVHFSQSGLEILYILGAPLRAKKNSGAKKNKKEGNEKRRKREKRKERRKGVKRKERRKREKRKERRKKKPKRG